MTEKSQTEQRSHDGASSSLKQPNSDTSLGKNQSTSQWQEMIDSRVAMLGILFFVTAACGLHWLWRSRGFTRKEKIWLTVIVSVYTAIVLTAFGAVMWWCGTSIYKSLYG